jgi:anthranilate phosphoribosyltransferase
MLRMVLQGTISPMRDIALLNAAAGLVIAGKCRELKDGLIAAADAVDSGKAMRTLDALVKSSQIE